MNMAENESTAIQKTTVQRKEIKQYLEDNKAGIFKMLPSNLDKERYLGSAILAVYRSPKLAECTAASIYSSIVNAAELKLDFTPAKRHAYLVPYYNNNKKCYEAQFMPGYGGLIDLALRTGKVSNIEAHLVHEKDTFVIEYGTQPRLIHTPYIDDDPGKVRGAYAIAFFPDGRFQFDYMRFDELEAIRKRSKASESGPWVTDTKEMYRKTPVRRLFKYLPSSPELDKAIEYDHEVVGLEDDIAPQKPYQNGSKTESLLQNLAEDAKFQDMPEEEPPMIEPDRKPESAPEPPKRTAKTDKSKPEPTPVPQVNDAEEIPLGL